MYSLGYILIQEAAPEFISTCVPAFFTDIRLVGAAGEVVCLEACLGGPGEDGFTGAEVWAAGES